MKCCERPLARLLTAIWKASLPRDGTRPYRCTVRHLTGAGTSPFQCRVRNRSGFRSVPGPARGRFGVRVLVGTRTRLGSGNTREGDRDREMSLVGFLAIRRESLGSVIRHTSCFVGSPNTGSKKDDPGGLP